MMTLSREPRKNQPKSEEDFDKEDEILMSLNERAMNMLFSALNSTKLNHISSCD